MTAYPFKPGQSLPVSGQIRVGSQQPLARPPMLPRLAARAFSPQVISACDGSFIGTANTPEQLAVLIRERNAYNKDWRS